MFNPQKLKQVPLNPGVYLWKNAQQTIIYVGKAKVLRHRMKQYFARQTNPRTISLVQHIADFEYIITHNDRDALILERNLIRRHQPEYNVLLTDDKRYPYLKLWLKDELEVRVVRVIKNDQAHYYGPFPSGFGARNIYKLILRLTKYRNGLPYHSQDRHYWEAQLVKAKALLKPHNNHYYQALEQEMYDAAAKMQYEIAQELKEVLSALNFYQHNEQIVQLNHNLNIDVYGITEQAHFLSISVMFFRFGSLLSKRDFVLEIQIQRRDTMRQFLAMYYQDNLKPDLIMIERQYYDAPNLYDKIKVLHPQKGRNKKMIMVAKVNSNANLSLKLATYQHKHAISVGAITTLGAILKMAKPNHLVMFDNSHTNNANPVGVVVTYRNGIKQKSEYLKFNLMTRDRLADVDYLEQALIKYLTKLGDQKRPDLFIMDGGIAQVRVAKKMLAEANVQAPVIGLVKDQKHHTKALIDLNETTITIADDNLFNFLKALQFEVDRFAKHVHRRRNSISSFQGKIINIKGVGPQTLQRLLRHFKTYSAIYNASLAELATVVTPNLAQKIHTYLRQNQTS